MYLQKESSLVNTGETHRWTAGTSGCSKKGEVVPMGASMSTTLWASTACYRDKFPLHLDAVKRENSVSSEALPVVTY
jgi:hypothetical protein